MEHDPPFLFFFPTELGIFERGVLMRDVTASETLYQKLLCCDWLQNCGSEVNTNDQTKYQLVKERSKAIKGIEGTKWENVCLAEYGNLSEYLCLNHKKEYNENWNRIVNYIKKERLPALAEKIKVALAEAEYPSSVLDDIQFNLLAIMVCDVFSDRFHSDFFDNLLEIYLSGHIPCGWKGKYPAGIILVY